MRKKTLLGRGTRWEKSGKTGKSTISSQLWGPPGEEQRDAGMDAGELERSPAGLMSLAASIFFFFYTSSYHSQGLASFKP